MSECGVVLVKPVRAKRRDHPADAFHGSERAAIVSVKTQRADPAKLSSSCVLYICPGRARLLALLLLVKAGGQDIQSILLARPRHRPDHLLLQRLQTVNVGLIHGVSPDAVLRKPDPLNRGDVHVWVPLPLRYVRSLSH